MHHITGLLIQYIPRNMHTVLLCFALLQSFIMNSHEAFIHIHQGCFAGTGAIVRLPQCQWSKPDGYGKISQFITTRKHSKAKTVCIFLGIYCKRKPTGERCIPLTKAQQCGKLFHTITSPCLMSFRQDTLPIHTRKTYICTHVFHGYFTKTCCTIANTCNNYWDIFSAA